MPLPAGSSTNVENACPIYLCFAHFCLPEQEWVLSLLFAKQPLT